MTLDRERVREANPLEDVVAELTGESLQPGAGDDKRFRCSLHGDGVDAHPSGRVNIAKQQYYCDVCGTGGDVFDFVTRQKDCSFKDALWHLAQRAGIDLPPPMTCTASYDYLDLSRTPRYQAQRLDDGHGRKSFRQRRADGHGGWIRGTGTMTGVGRMVYRWPELRDQHTVYVVEGEKCADELWTHGIPATTSPGGAGKWNAGPFHEGQPYADQLKTVGVQTLVILPDADDPGWRHAEDAALACQAAGLSVKVVNLPGLPPKGDVADYLQQQTKDALLAVVEAAPLWDGPTRPSGTPPARREEQLLHDISAFLRRYVVLSPEQLITVAAWVVHTHAFGAAETTPYLSVTSATKQAGKTRLLEALELLVAKPWFTGRATAAVLVRRIANESPTLLLDESDAAFKVESEYTEALRSILNSGHRMGGCASVCTAGGASYLDLATFSPKAIAGIGRLPDTVADRSLPIRLKRRSRAEPVERFRHRDAAREAAPLRERITRWTVAYLDTLRSAKPTIPSALGDRAADVCEPLLAIADAVGGDAPDHLRRAVVLLCTGREDEQSRGTQLLADIRDVFDERGGSVLFSEELLEQLVRKEESPWSDYKQGKPLTKNGLARLLKAFEIRPAGTIRVGDRTGKGYQRPDFEDTWNRYLPFTTVTPSQVNNDGGPSPDPTVTPTVTPLGECDGVTVEGGNVTDDQPSLIFDGQPDTALDEETGDDDVEEF
jgi:hypothetical protein